MNKKNKIRISKAVKDLYLYPNRSKGENVLRGAVWLSSWIVGIMVQTTTDYRAMGGAYIIFAVSLLLEFITEGRNSIIARIAHGMFCILLLLMLLGALLWSYGDAIVLLSEDSSFIGVFLMNAPVKCGTIVCLMMFIGVVFSLLEVHKLFYDEDAEERREKEMIYQSVREQFANNLNGMSKGGNA